MGRLLIISHNYGDAVKKLKQELNAVVRTKKSRRYGEKVSQGNGVINWGTIHFDKLLQFKLLTENNVRTVQWTTDKNTATKWKDEGSSVFCRMLLNSSKGKGIVMFSGSEAAPLYTRFLNAKFEYRIHVFDEKVIHIQQKRRKVGWETDRKFGIRNLDNGYIFACTDIYQPTDDVLAQAIAAVKALGLEFGAVDILQYKNEGYVLEVNTAPGLEGTTLSKYVEAFKEKYNG